MLAAPIKDVEERKLKIGEFYSGMTPYASWQTNYTYTENNSLGSSATVGINVGASAGVQNGQNMSVTDSTADTENSSVTETESQQGLARIFLGNELTCFLYSLCDLFLGDKNSLDGAVAVILGNGCIFLSYHLSSALLK